MQTIYLALGSNLGNKSENIKEALRLISLQIGTVEATSSLYETVPEGFISDNQFLNAACKVSTELSMSDLLTQTKAIEKQIGRKAKSVDNQYADRLIDIDILLYGKKISLTLDLTIPHAQMHKRMFVLEPLAEIAPHAVHPILNKTIEELKNTLK